ncbi:MAG: hypothetical protein K2H90_07885 [Oscillospiraceae bacterium]|nr:hypothetical protein [Oscillospiraceae bacterium]MDE6132614.1 hypothetical protein [Oscillospiraceae bacterium]
MKKFLTALLAMALAVSCFAACNKEEGGDTAEATGYTGILTKVKLGMPLTKIVTINQSYDVDLNYETDTVIWSQNPDTELMEIRDIIPAESAYYYVDDSLITYNFETRKGDDEIYLIGYMSEAYCLLDRTIAESYFDTKGKELAAKHGVEPSEVRVGTEDVDLEVSYLKRYSCSSYDLTFTMKEKYDTVDGVEGYYGSYFAIEVSEKAVKDEVAVDSSAAE